MFIPITGGRKIKSGVIAVRCPFCKRESIFSRIGDLDDWGVPPYLLGQRRCPNPECKGHIFFVYNNETKEVKIYPPQRIDFDTRNIPEKIVSVFEESLTCHANECFVAAGIMIRRTLEEICVDKNASGHNLKERINSLKDKVILPKELFEGMNELRILGNDAAHVEAKCFGEIGKKEIEISIQFTKEILKAVYQYSDLLAKIKSLKRQNSV